jgi:transcriptional regulator with XRE-family HTH domain
MDFSLFRQKVGKRIYQLRVNKGLTQEDMDEGDDGIPVRTIQNIEGGKSNPNLKTIYRLAKRLGIKPKELLDI